MDIVFKGEHLLPGHLGQFLVVLAFGTSLISTISYFFAVSHKEDAAVAASWRRMARISFYTNVASIIGIGVSLFYIIFNNYFEYHYAWAYSSRTLPVYYIISSFWNGQEGSFWLWTFWQGILGLILIASAKSWESPVLTVVALSQALLASMLLGIELFGLRIGSSPFILLRDAVEGPIFKQANYLDFIKDGSGMNPLLQNYWMVIHPPTLFLGFASMVVPFAYAIAGLWQRRYKEWVQPALSYSLFSVMVLGTGIVMGAFWAYESLNFGGYWAWDPVENASILPWLTLIGAVHVLIVYKNTGHSYFTATLLVLVSFLLTLYASFLTRSGILGETSVHAFTDLGMTAHLVADVLIFLAITVWLLVVRWKELPITKKDEETYSREFWLFVGSVFLALSCFHLFLVTSIPVWNKLFGTHMAPPTEPVKHYNVIQASFAVVIMLLTGFSQFLKYKNTNSAKFFIRALVYLLVSGVISGVIIYLTGVYHLHFVYGTLLFAAVYSVMSNGKVLADAFSGKFKLAGSAVAHIGFGLLLVGAVISGGTQKIASVNESGVIEVQDFEKAANPRENLMLYRNKPVQMGEYQITYIGDSLVAPNHYFKVAYKRFDKAGKVVEQFVLKPNSQANPKMGLVSSPDTRHYLFHDLYTHVTAAPLKDEMEANADPEHMMNNQDDDKNYNEPVAHELAIGDSVHYRDGYIVLKGLNKQPKIQSITLGKNDIAVGAMLEVTTGGRSYSSEPVFMIKDNNTFDFARKVDDAGLKLRFAKINPETHKVQIMVYQQLENKRPYIVMRAIDFPYINFFWSGTLIMIIGFLMSIFRRNKELTTAEAKPTAKRVKADMV